MPSTRGSAPRWAPKIDPAKIRRLYESEAAGLLDEELLDDVSIALLLRCRSMLAVTSATEGQVTCPECGCLILRTDPKLGRQRNDELIRCSDCDWSITWEQFYRSYKGKQLFVRNALSAVKTFVDGFDAAFTPRARLMAIDRLIHAFHNELLENPNRPVAINVIAGKWPDVVGLILDLAYRTDDEMGQTHRDWRDRLARCTLPPISNP